MFALRSKSTKWCCSSFKSHYEEAGKRGSAVLVGRNYFGDPHVTFQFRAMNIEEEMVLDTQIPVSVVVDVEIMHCPWCGRNVRKWYARSVDELSRDGLKIDIKADHNS